MYFSEFNKIHTNNFAFMQPKTASSTHKKADFKKLWLKPYSRHRHCRFRIPLIFLARDLDSQVAAKSNV